MLPIEELNLIHPGNVAATGELKISGAGSEGDGHQEDGDSGRGSLVLCQSCPSPSRPLVSASDKDTAQNMFDEEVGT